MGAVIALALLSVDIVLCWAVLTTWPPRILNRRGCHHWSKAGRANSKHIRCIACGKRFRSDAKP